ncbi:MAG: glycosyltransferase family 2 protein [Clostridia bacterium]|nr:glycosyltransferase family 2 protein [Clostridia bacterium]
MKEKPVLWVVVPCFNEQDVLPITAPMFLKELQDLEAAGKISENSRVLFVNDGSRDRTWEIIQELSKSDAHFLGIAQSRNRGHQNAVLAGLMEAKDRCDITISIDCDGQDDLSAMEKMIDAYRDGCEIVYGVRAQRKTDTRFKRTTAQGFYRLMRAMGADIVYNHADYRLVSSRVLEHFADYREVNVFLRGMFPLVGFRSTSVCYDRKERLAGKSHYPLRKMLALALDGITSLSVRPLHLIGMLGLFVCLFGLLLMIWAVAEAVHGRSVAGWASLLCVTCLLGGIQLISLGVIGQYVGKIYMETKRRPRYIISERTWEEQETAREQAKHDADRSV